MEPVVNFSSVMLCSAARDGHKETVEKLIDHGVDPDSSRDRHGRTPLHLAIDTWQEDTIIALLFRGADVDVQDDYGWTPLHRAVAANHMYLVEILLAYDADINKTTYEGYTPLSITKFNNYRKMEELLKKEGATE